MKIKGKLNADIVGFAIKRNKSHDGSEAAVDIDVGVTEEDAKEKFGADFHVLAFGTMRVMEAEGDDDVDAIAFMQDTIKPGSRVVFESHKIKLDGETITEQPELLSIKTVDGEARVIARLRIPVKTDKTAAINSLVQSVGKTVKVEFNPQQGELELRSPKGSNGKATEEASAH